ncbi:MAG: hypothetical protein H7124_02975 [Phycisphaerales bacterium]|nr:hypothetical protein [Hyphomonadaceae bacterium]
MDIGNASDVLTAVATIGTLIFLAVQVRDNTRMTRTSTLGAMLQNARERTAFHLCDSAEVSDIVARGVNSLEALDEKQRFRFTFFLVDMALHMQNIMELHASGLMSKTDHDAWLEWTSAVYRTPGAQALWPQISAVLTSTIRDLLQAHIYQNPNAPTIVDIMPVFRRSGLGVAAV